MQEELILVGQFKDEFSLTLGKDFPNLDIYRSKGLPTHLLKRNHYKALKYIDYISDIINNPDFIGINPNEGNNESIELIKRYKDNIMIGIKISSEKGYYYVATMHEIQESKIQRRLNSGRLKQLEVDK